MPYFDENTGEPTNEAPDWLKNLPAGAFAPAAPSPEPGNWLSAGLGVGTHELLSDVGSLGQGIGAITGWQGLQQAGGSFAASQQAAAQADQRPDLDAAPWYSPTKIGYELASSAPGLATALVGGELGAAARIGRFAGTALGMFPQIAGSNIQAEQKGDTTAPVSRGGALAALAVGAPEAALAGLFPESLRAGAGAKLGGRLLTGVAAGGLLSGGNAALQTGVDQYLGDDQTPIADRARAVVDSALQGGLIGGIMGGAFSLFHPANKPPGDMTNADLNNATNAPLGLGGTDVVRGPPPTAYNQIPSAQLQAIHEPLDAKGSQRTSAENMQWAVVSDEIARRTQPGLRPGQGTLFEPDEIAARQPDIDALKKQVIPETADQNDPFVKTFNAASEPELINSLQARMGLLDRLKAAKQSEGAPDWLNDLAEKYGVAKNGQASPLLDQIIDLTQQQQKSRAARQAAAAAGDVDTVKATNAAVNDLQRQIDEKNRLVKLHNQAGDILAAAKTPSPPAGLLTDQTSTDTTFRDVTGQQQIGPPRLGLPPPDGGAPTPPGPDEPPSPPGGPGTPLLANEARIRREAFQNSLLPDETDRSALNQITADNPVSLVQELRGRLAEAVATGQPLHPSITRLAVDNGIIRPDGSPRDLAGEREAQYADPTQAALAQEPGSAINQIEKFQDLNARATQGEFPDVPATVRPVYAPQWAALNAVEKGTSDSAILKEAGQAKNLIENNAQNAGDYAQLALRDIARMKEGQPVARKAPPPARKAPPPADVEPKRDFAKLSRANETPPFDTTPTGSITPHSVTYAEPPHVTAQMHLPEIEGALGAGAPVGTRVSDLDYGHLVPEGVVAYHGSPHDFDRFDISKIGTGEGAQVFGHGLYFAEKEGIAKGYRDKLSAQTTIPADVKFDASVRIPTAGKAGALARWAHPAVWARQALIDAGGDAAKAKEGVAKDLAERIRPAAKNPAAEVRKAKENAKDAINLINDKSKWSYEPEKVESKSPESDTAHPEWKKTLAIVDQIDADVEAKYPGSDVGDLTYWMGSDRMGGRKVANESAKYIQDAADSGEPFDAAHVEALKLGVERLDSLPKPEPRIAQPSLYRVKIAGGKSKFLDWDVPLADQHPFVRKALSDLGITSAGDKSNDSGKTLYGLVDRNPVEAAKILRAAGIKGIRYLDGGSRKKGEGTENLVAFDDKDVQITHKNGVEVPPAPLSDHLQADAHAEFGQELSRAGLSTGDLSTDLRDRAQALTDSGERADPGKALEQASLAKADPEDVSEIYGDAARGYGREIAPESPATAGADVEPKRDFAKLSRAFDTTPTGSITPHSVTYAEPPHVTAQMHAPEIESALGAGAPAGTRVSDLDYSHLAPGGIVAYHGSPHDFDRFDISKIGTGEGAQAFGHGLYFAERRGLAEHYRDTLASIAARMNPTIKAITDKIAADFEASHPGADFGGASIQDLTDNMYFDHMDGRKIADEIKSYIEEGGFDSPLIREILARGVADLDSRGPPEPHIPTPTLYQVRISHPEDKLLSWDKPFDDQSPHVRAALRSIGITGGSSGDVIYNELSGDPAAAANRLAEAGIPGIIYLDKASRSSGAGTRNIVAFRDSDVTVTHKNGVEVPRAPLSDHLQADAHAEFGQELSRDGLSISDLSTDLKDRAQALMDSGERADPGKALEQAALAKADPEDVNEIYGDAAQGYGKEIAPESPATARAEGGPPDAGEGLRLAGETGGTPGDGSSVLKKFLGSESGGSEDSAWLVAASADREQLEGGHRPGEQVRDLRQTCGHGWRSGRQTGFGGCCAMDGFRRRSGANGGQVVAGCRAVSRLRDPASSVQSCEGQDVQRLRGHVQRTGRQETSTHDRFDDHRSPAGEAARLSKDVASAPCGASIMGDCQRRAPNAGSSGVYPLAGRQPPQHEWGRGAACL